MVLEAQIARLALRELVPIAEELAPDLVTAIERVIPGAAKTLSRSDAAGAAGAGAERAHLAFIDEWLGPAKSGISPAERLGAIRGHLNSLPDALREEAELHYDRQFEAFTAATLKATDPGSAQYTALTGRGIDLYSNLLGVHPQIYNDGRTIADIGSGIEQNLSREISQRGWSSRILNFDPRLALRLDKDLSMMDLSPQGAAELESRLRGRLAPQPFTYAAYGAQLPLRTGSVRSVQALNSVTRYQSEPAQVLANLKEIGRVLEPGGDGRLYPIARTEYSNYRTSLNSLGLPGKFLPYKGPVMTPRVGFDPNDLLLVIDKPK